MEAEMNLRLLLKNDILRKNNDSEKVLRFIDQDDDYHENFGIQWNRFSKIQLDSFNGSTETEDRLFLQSGLKPEDLEGKTILEVGCGNGRFTEVFLKYGANVIAVDYSSAIDANYKNHTEFVNSGQLLLIQASVFDLPLKENSFDMVFCYGVVQHTGNNKEALNCLSKMPGSHGSLFVDIYPINIRGFNPLVYLMRLYLKLMRYDERKTMNLVERFVGVVFPYELKVLTFLHNRKGFFKIIKLLFHRIPNSMYGISLYLDGKIRKDIDIAYQWSLMDTYDSWAPKHDHPMTKRAFKKELKKLTAHDLKVYLFGRSGQGWFAGLKKL